MFDYCDLFERMADTCYVAILSYLDSQVSINVLIVFDESLSVYIDVELQFGCLFELE